MIDAGILGEQIAFHRRRRGLSQTEFARLLDRSESWVSQVERGARSIDRLTVLGRVSEVLDVPLSELVGDQTQTPFPVRSTEHPEAAMIRKALGTPYAIEALLKHAYRAAEKPPTLTSLRQQVEPLWDLAHKAMCKDLSQQLSKLIPQIETALHCYEANQQQTVLELAVTTYQVTAALLAKLGEGDAVWVAGDRAMSAAERLGDPLKAIASAYRLALAFVSSHRLDEAIHVAEGAANAVEPYCSDEQLESWSIWGSLHLVLAVAKSRKNDATAARNHIRHASNAAKKIGEERNDFETQFGSTNVTLHAVSIEVELGNPGEALRLAENVDVSLLLPERRSSFHLYLATANQQRRQAAEAVRHLLIAEEAAPELIYRHPRSRQIVLDLLRNQRSTPGLADLAERMRVINDLPVQKVLDSTETAG